MISGGSCASWVALGALALCACSAEQPGEAIAEGQFAVIDGVPVPEATNIVLVFDMAVGGATQCAGVLLAPNVVLCTRSCVSETPAMFQDCTTPLGPAHVPADVLVINAQDANTPGTPWSVTNIAVPPDASNCGNNLALLTLATVVDAADAVPLDPRLDAPVVSGELFTAYGYGPTTVGGNDSGVRRKREGVEVTCAGDCVGQPASVWGSTIGPCMLDGPAVGADGLLIGLVDRGTGDCTEGWAQGLAAHADWLRAEVVTAAATGGYPAPAWAGGPTDAGTGGSSGAGGSSGTGGAGGESGTGATGGASGTGGTGTAGAAGATGGSAGTSGSAPSAAPADEDDSGCSCTVRSEGPRPIALLLAAIATLIATRRRSSRK